MKELERQNMFRRVIKRVSSGFGNMVLVSSIAMSGVGTESSTNSPSLVDLGSSGNFLVWNNPRPPLDIHLAQIADPTPTPQPIEVLPASTPEPTINYSEMNRVILQMQKRPDLFSQQDVEDVEMYYPIYKIVADKYGIDWEDLWIIQLGESTVSRNPKARDGSTYPLVGPTQINLEDYDMVFILGSAEGLKFLAYFPQRYPDDYIYIAAAGRILHDDEVRYQSYGYSQKEAKKLALQHYSGPKSGAKRDAIISEYILVLQKKAA